MKYLRWLGVAKGWRRLWVVVAVPLTVWAGFLVAGSLESPSPRLSLEIGDYHADKCFKPLFAPDLIPRSLRRIDRSLCPTLAREYGVKHYRVPKSIAAYEAQISDKNLTTIFQGVGLWLGFLSGLYLVPLVVFRVGRWVVRGFRAGGAA